MNREQFKSRCMLVFFIFCSLYSVILFNLYFLQIRNKDFYANLASRQYNATITNIPERALIYDRNHHSLALNKQQYSAFIIPKKLQQSCQLEQFLSQYFPQAQERLKTQRSSAFMFIKRKLTDHELMLIKKSKINDLHIVQEPSRYYPLLAAGPIIGITDIENNGLFGIEKMCNTQLLGVPSIHTLEKDARSGIFYFAKKTKTQGCKGTHVTLTIDAELQFLAYEELKDSVERFAAQEGSVIIVDPTHGDILALVQYPSFDPNNTIALDIARTKVCAVTDTYEPGSVMKPFVALAALQEGVVSKDEQIDCESEKFAYINGMKICTPKPHGMLTFSQIIQKSNNIGIAKVAQRLGSKLYDYLLKLGFVNKTEIDFLGEHEGFINPPHKWSKRSLSSLSFGYELTVTLLQIAQAFCIIANGGYRVQLHLMCDEQKNFLSLQPVFNKDVIQVLRDILHETITSNYCELLEGFKVMGKTGTSNILVNGVYDNTRNIFTFAGILEKGAYKRVIITFIRDSGYKNLYASQVTVPLFMRIAELMILHEKMF